MVLPWALFDNVSTKPGLKIFRDEYKSITAACLDLGFAKKACNSRSYTGILSHLAEDLLSLLVSSTCVLVVRSSVNMSPDIVIIMEWVRLGVIFSVHISQVHINCELLERFLYKLFHV